VVTVGNGLARVGHSQKAQAYQALPCRETKPKTMWSCMWNPLPILTGSCARGAKPIGAFGLVMGPITIAYHPLDLALLRPCGSFTNLRLRHGGLDIHSTAGDEYSTVGHSGTARAMWHSTAQHSHTVHTVRSGTHRRTTHTRSVIEKKKKKSGHRSHVFFTLWLLDWYGNGKIPGV
jgi:hypothetical protein